MNPKTILIIDDEPDLLMVLAFSLEIQGGYRVLTANSGAEGLELLRTQSVDAVVTDVRMPGLGGMSLFHQVQCELPVAPPFILSTGFSDFSVHEAFHDGVEAVLVKPFELSEFQKAVERATAPKLQRWKALQDRSGNPRLLKTELESPEALLSEGHFKLGRGGMRILVPELAPRVQDPVRIEVRFASGSPSLQASGTIRWVMQANADSNDSLCGIEFDSMDERSRELVLGLTNGARGLPFIPQPQKSS